MPPVPGVDETEVERRARVRLKLATPLPAKPCGLAFAMALEQQKDIERARLLREMRAAGSANG